MVSDPGRSHGRDVCLGLLNQRTVKSLHSGDPDVMSFTLCDPLHTHCAIRVKEIKALLVKSMCHLPHTLGQPFRGSEQSYL